MIAGYFIFDGITCGQMRIKARGTLCDVYHKDDESHYQ